MGLSRLAKACRDCPSGMSAAAPILRETMTVNAGDGTTVQVYKDDIKRELEKHLYEHLYSHLYSHLQLGG